MNNYFLSYPSDIFTNNSLGPILLFAIYYRLRMIFFFILTFNLLFFNFKIECFILTWKLIMENQEIVWISFEWINIFFIKDKHEIIYLKNVETKMSNTSIYLWLATSTSSPQLRFPQSNMYSYLHKVINKAFHINSFPWLKINSFVIVSSSL